ncbi:MAG: AAA family ATPase [Pseudomonadota bacterium]
MGMNIKDIEINAQFAAALNLMEEGGRPLFITGRAGTGKSTLLEYFRATTKRKAVILAPTGVAAVNVSGQTLHSFFGFRPDITVEKAAAAAKKAVKAGRAGVYRKMETLVIDEISMVRADLFDCADAFLRTVRGRRAESFGGVHVAMIGDLYQLPPVVTSHEAGIFSSHYASPYFFDSHACRAMEVEIVELEKIYRQRDDRFIALLNSIRNNTAGEAEIAALNERCDPDFDPGDGSYIHLTSLNREADAINERRLDALPGKARRFAADVSGTFDEKSFPAGSEVILKSGAQVMLLSNDPLGRWVNGTIGTVRSVRADSADVKLSGGSIENIGPHTWQMFRFGLDKAGKSIVSEAVGKFTQIPLALAWAVTIHKAQGKTFDRAVIDIGRVFACGQTYVALSRARSLDGIVLKSRLKKGHVRVDPRVVKFLTSHHYAISEKKMPLADKIRMIEEAIETGKLLEMSYLKASDVKSARIIEPLEVGEMEYAGRAFPGLRAICRKRNEERVFRVDRILEMKILS